MVHATPHLIISPELVGRADQIMVLTRSIEQALAGHGQTVLITGEAGIGKSRLVDETRRRFELASTGPGLILRGQCFEPDRSLPYGPVLDLLRTCILDRPPSELATLFAATGADLVTLLPELGALLPGLQATPPLEPEAEKRRLFQALLQFVVQFGRPLTMADQVITKAGVVAPTMGRQLNVMGHTITIKLAGAETAGNSYVFEVTTPPGLSIPPHRHEREDEVIYVLEGEFAIWLDGQVSRATAGSTIHFPRHIAHGFENTGPTPGKTLWVVTPGANFEPFFEELGALPPGPPDLARVVAIFSSYGMTILPPPA